MHLGISLGINFAIFSLLGYFGGTYLDDRLGTSPLLMVLGLVMGAGLAFYSLIKEILALDKVNRKGEDD